MEMKAPYMKAFESKCKIIFVATPRAANSNIFYHECGTTTALSELRSMMRKSGHFLSESQLELVLQHLSFPITPQQIEFICRTASTWQSFTTERSIRRDMQGWSRNPLSFAIRVVNVIQKQYEKKFYRSAVCFISCARNGLTHQEIVDLISRDKKYLGSHGQLRNANASSLSVTQGRRPVRRHAIKPRVMAAPERCDSIIDINSLWYQLLEGLQDLLTECYADGAITLMWKYPIIAEAVQSTYMDTPEDIQYYHKVMTSYFCNSAEVCRCGKTHDCHQPLRWKGPTETIWNYRRLNESIYHAMKANEFEIAKSKMLFDFEWLQAKLYATSIEFVMDEIYEILLMKPDDLDIRLLLEGLFLSYDVLNNDPTQLPSQLLGRLNDIIEKDFPLAPQDPRKYPHARVLLFQIKRSESLYLMPTTTCLTSGTNIIFDPLKGHEDSITAIACYTDGQRIVTAAKDSTIKVWGVAEKCVLRTIENVGADIESLCLCMGNYYVAAVNADNHINVWNIQKAEQVLSIKSFKPKQQVVITVAMDGQLLAAVSKTSAIVKAWDLDKMSFHKETSILPEKGKCPDLSVARNSHAANILIGYKNFPTAFVINVRRGKVARTLSCEHGRVTQVEISREYYIVGCKQRTMEFHEIQHFFMFDGINYGLVRVLKSCTEDVISDIFVNRLGSHLIGFCQSHDGKDEVVVWNLESDGHRHMAQSQSKIVGGVCNDLQYCMTVLENERFVRVQNLAADRSRTQVKKVVDGIGRLLNMPNHAKYVIAQGMGGSPITIWNVARSKCRGEAVIVERGLLEKNDIVVVKDVLVVILSDRGISLSEQVFETAYVYNLLLRKYERKLRQVQITICPPDHYHLIGKDKLLATSTDRTFLKIWSIETGDVLYEIHPNFRIEPIREESLWQKRRRLGYRRISEKSPLNEPSKMKTNWKTCTVSPAEQKKAILEMLLSEDESTLICSYYARHLVVFNLTDKGTHKHTLTDMNSVLHLQKAVVTPNGEFLLSMNYDNEDHSTYLTLWSLNEGRVARRRKNEPKICSMAVTDDGLRIVFVTEDNFMKIWDPFKRHSHRRIAGYHGLDVKSADSDNTQPTTVFITMKGKRAILFANSISVWDLEAESLLMVFEPDMKFTCCTVALNGQVIVVGRKDSSSITTLRLPETDLSGRDHQGNDRFGEEVESDSDSLLSGNEDDAA